MNHSLLSGAFQNQVTNIVNNNFGGLIGGTISVEELNAKMIKATDIVGKNGFFEYLQSKLITTDKIIADSATFKSMTTNVANIKNAIIGMATTETGITINLTAENATISEALIKNLMSEYITVSDLKAGNIITDKINVLSQDGKLKIVGNTITVYDDKNNPVIQLGQDKNGNYGLVISDSKGAILLDSQGLHEGIVPDNFVKNEMIDNGTISEEKLAFKTVKADPVTGKLDSAQVTIDGKGLDLEFKSIQSSVENLDQKIDNSANYEIRISWSNGSTFHRGCNETTGTVTLLKNGVDVTDQYDDKYFIWKRKSSDSAGDTYWNEQHSIGTKTLRITRDDVFIGASFGCSFNFEKEG